MLISITFHVETDRAGDLKGLPFEEVVKKLQDQSRRLVEDGIQLVSVNEIFPGTKKEELIVWRCPRCNSAHVAADLQGFLNCLDCQHKWIDLKKG